MCAPAAACADPSTECDVLVMEGRSVAGVACDRAARLASGVATRDGLLAPSVCPVDGRANAWACATPAAADALGRGTCDALYPSLCGEGPPETPGVAET